MSKNEIVETEHGTVNVIPRTSKYRDLEGGNVYYRGRFIGAVIPEGDGEFSVLVTGLAPRDADQVYLSRLDALTFLAGVGRARYGEED